jgi:putative spermidine/putrescine transport system permease protein
VTDTVAEIDIVRTNDGVPLKTKLARTNRINRMMAGGLVLPLFAFIIITFVIPIANMMYRSVDNPVIIERMPETVALIQHWDGEGLPSEEVYASTFRELSALFKVKDHAKVGTRLNYYKGGMRSLITRSARKLKRVKSGPYREALIKIDKRWGEKETWTIFKLNSTETTFSFLLAAMDMKYDLDGDVVQVEEDRQIYVNIFGRTLWISLLVTGVALLLGFPLAYLLATLPLATSNLLMIMVLLPFWTSLLVRTTSWIVLLQTQGVVNDVLVWLGILSEDGRVQLIYNQTGTIVAMTHILLPFMVLPLFSVMKTIPPTYLRAARSLGATPTRAFWQVYAPLTVPGAGAGCILVFILSVGYYITPALVGGRTGQMISNFIAFHMQKSLNWGLAAALGALLLFGVLGLYWLYGRIVGVDKMKFG